MAQLDEVKSLFEIWAGNGRAEGMESGHGPTATQAFEALRLGPQSRYLDIGCGSGYTLRWAQTAGSEEVWGIDLSPGMIEKTRELSGAGSATMQLLSGPFPHADIPENHFDAIFSMEVFYYLPSLSEGLQAVYRSLRSGGRFACIVDFYQENPDSHSWPEDVGVKMTLWSESQWKSGFEAAGFTEVEQRRLYPEKGQAPEEWKYSQGSLLTLGYKA